MSYSLIIRPAALNDLEEGRDWYDEQDDGLGDRFVDAVDQAIRRVAAAPKNYKPAIGECAKRWQIRSRT